jgi:hypothetical protein
VEIVTIVSCIAGGFIGKYILDFIINRFKKPEELVERKFELIQGEPPLLRSIGINDDKHFEFYQQMLNKLLEDKLNKKV